MHQWSIHVFFLLVLCALNSCGAGDPRAIAPDAFSSAETLVRQSTCPAAPTPLHDISKVQDGHASAPKFGQQVTLRGVVTGDFQSAKQLHGFFMQQPTHSQRSKGSAGIFVALPAKNIGRVVQGRYVQVSGTLEELGSKASDDARLGKLAAVTLLSDCGSAASITPQQLHLPLGNRHQLDALEGMLVTLPQTLTVTDNHDLGTHGVLMLSADDRLWQPHNHPTLADPEKVTDLNWRSQLLLDDGARVVHPVPVPYLSASDNSGTRRAGDTVSHLEGILTRSMGEWRLQPTERPVFTPQNPRPEILAEVGGDLRVGSMNVLSYFTTLGQRGAKTEPERIRQRDKLVSTIAGLNADALGLMEIENNATALSDLVAAVNQKMGSETYAAVDSGVQGSDAIKLAIIYKPARLALRGAVEMPLPRHLSSGTELRRPPLAQQFSDRRSGIEFWLVVNHLKSKSRCPGANGFDHDRGQGCWNLTRTSQAKALHKWVQMLTARSAEPKVLLMGDFNAYLEEDPIRALESAGYEDLLKRLPADQRYSYIFDGRSGALDHGFASAALQPSVRGITLWHVNADEPAILDYVSGGKPDDRYAATPWRASDHDPVLVGLQLFSAGVR